MGFIADNVEKSRTALRNRPFIDQIETPLIMTADDLPFAPPPYKSPVDKAKEVVEQGKEQARAKHEAGFAVRRQSGWAAHAGPPGKPENRPIHVRPEQSPGNIFNEFV